MATQSEKLLASTKRFREHNDYIEKKRVDTIPAPAPAPLSVKQALNLARQRLAQADTSTGELAKENLAEAISYCIDAIDRLRTPTT